jgi:hypothetical protein
MALIDILAVSVPALFGAVSAVLFGHRQVRALREKTGDDSSLTKVLSGEFLRSSRKVA